ncbi:flavin reductase family protein [Streptomyces chrestomyceticus]|uniref:flavin reductase family protein n=1 Tax=Streptomyces chrestomyceticus TaxID=68185 RepID=UPI0035A902F4
MTAPLRTDPSAPPAHEFRRAMAHLPTSVTVVTTRDTEPVGCTASAVLSLSADPPGVLVSLAATSHTAQRIRHRGAFAVNALSWQQRSLTQQFASGDPHRRFHGVAHTVRHGQPVLADAAVGVVCTLETVHHALDHLLLVGRVIWCSHRTEYTPLVYHQHRTHPGPAAS